MTSHRKPAIAATLLLLPFVAILILQARHYWPFISDDALISLRYARRLLEGHGLTWTDGHPVEGYSNLLWILLVALLGAVGIDLIDAARLLGVAGMAAVMFSLLYWRLSRSSIREAWLPITLALLFLALSAPVAVWVIGGLEQPLYCALIAASIPLMFSVLESEDAFRRRVLALSTVLGLLCLTRPDGPIFAVVAAATLFLVRLPSGRRRPASQWLLVLNVPVLLSVGQLAFRISYYGELVPNTALVKITPSWTHWSRGLEYVSQGFLALAPFSVLALVCLSGMLASRRTRGRGLYLALAGIAWSTYVVAVGGDIFPAYRHLTPVIVLLSFALAEGAWAAVGRLRSRPAYLALLMALALALFVPYTSRQLNDRQSRRAVLERWEWEGREVGLLLKTAFSRQQPLLAVTAAGCLPYWSELPALDMMGLNDHYLPRHPPADMGTGLLGHELGDGRYVLSRKPDIIVFNVGSPPHYRSGTELEGLAAFHEQYVPVHVRIRALEAAAIIYFNKYSEKPGIGITRTDSAISVPGFLFKGEHTIAHLNDAQRLVASLTAEDPVRVTLDSEESLESWDVYVRAQPHSNVTPRIVQDGRSVSVQIHSRLAGPIAIEEVVIKRPRE